MSTPTTYKDIESHVNTLTNDGILVSYRADEDRHEIQANDHEGYFATDPDAWRFMLAKVNAGNEAYGAVLKFIESDNPEEFYRIVNVRL